MAVILSAERRGGGGLGRGSKHGKGREPREGREKEQKAWEGERTKRGQGKGVDERGREACTQEAAFLEAPRRFQPHRGNDDP